MRFEFCFLVFFFLAARCLSGDVSLLPAHIDEPAGTINSIDFPLDEGPKTKKFRLSVPENRESETSRNIRLYGYHLKARNPSGHTPIFVLGGGPGQFFDDSLIRKLNTKPTGGMLTEVWECVKTRDIVFVNQRGAGPAFLSMMFLNFGAPLHKPYQHESVNKGIEENFKHAIDRCEDLGIDLAGYDIVGLVEDLNDVRKKLGFKRIVLRGSSFGSQWSFAYAQKYPQHVDRAVLGGIEPIDHGWDSPQGIWNVMKRLDQRIAADRSELGFPEVSLNEAIKTIVQRLESSPVEATAGKKVVTIGPVDFQRAMLSNHGAHRETHASIAKLPKFIYESFNQNYNTLAWKAASKNSVQANLLQAYLVDNSLGISQHRESILNKEPGRRWIGELNATYKATREVTPTAVIPDSDRRLNTDMPLLMIQGDLDMSTPFENALEQLAASSNAHLIRVNGGTHAAIHQVYRHDASFINQVLRFLDADFNKQTVASLDLPDEISLPPIEFVPMSTEPE